MGHIRKKIPFIIANWKMYKQIPESLSYLKEFLFMLESNKKIECLIGIAPSFTAISSLREAARSSQIRIGAQNMHEEVEGAFTGEISSRMLIDAGASFVLLGHSERRHRFNETNEQICRKLHRAMISDLLPILCVGETEMQRESGRSVAVIQEQLSACLEGISSWNKLAIAYEPVWAIGTGKSATSTMAQEIHFAIYQFLVKKFGVFLADATPLLYGGSVNPANANALLKEPNIDGLLVGGASLQPKSFFEILQQGCLS